MVSMNYQLNSNDVKSKNPALNWPKFAMRVNRSAMRKGWHRAFDAIVGPDYVDACFDRATDKLRDVVFWEYCQPKE